MDDGPDLTDLAPVWAQSLEREGLTSPVRVALWLEEHPEPPLAHVDMLMRRMRSEVGVMDLAAEAGLPHSRIQAILRRAGLRVVVPHLTDLAAWARARASGVPDDTIADLAHTQPEVVALALDGWPQRSQGPGEAAVAEAYTAWVHGAPTSEVAAILKTTPDRLRHDLASGESSLPVRLRVRDVAVRFGWNRSTVTRHQHAELLPPTDGMDGTAHWWWQSTIDQWAEATAFHACPACRCAFLTATGLKGHRTREHQKSDKQG